MMNNNLGFTCSDVLLIPHFNEAVVLAGSKGMHRTISRVNVMEVPDVVDWVRPGEFLITSGFPFQDHPEIITDLIPQLVDKGVAAFGIKTKRYIDKIPDRALELADKLDFPIFELPPSTSFSDVVREIMERVLVQEARNLSVLQSRVQKMSQKLLQSEGLDEFLRSLEEMVENPVMIVDDVNQVILSPEAKQLINVVGDHSFLYKLREDSKTGVSFINIHDRRIRVYIANINTKQHHHCLLLLFEYNKEYAVVDQLTIDRISILVGLEMMNINARKEVESKYIDQFLQDWLTGKIGNDTDLKMRADACGYPLDDNSSFVVSVARWLGKKPDSDSLQQLIKQNRSQFLLHGIHVTLLEGELTFLLSKSTETDPEMLLDSIHRQLEGQFQLCIGKNVMYVNQVYDSYLQAKKIHHISTICNLEAANMRFNQLGVFQLLFLLPECEELIEFRARFITPIIQYDQKHNTMLFETLKVYFKNNKSTKKASKELFTHYNTIGYRIERVCEILQLKLEDGDDMLLLQLAVKVYEMSPQNSRTFEHKLTPTVSH
ncbi:PucR family transcriptional regulator [Radiobacillus sp. PE A8.2]|uniref:PucR family transcriptional regulator n=1 Tax=Radiobacillus sp. PE A8.2 TaxID=3380349 RepID=UPI00388DCA1E